MPTHSLGLRWSISVMICSAYSIAFEMAQMVTGYAARGLLGQLAGCEDCNGNQQHALAASSMGREGRIFALCSLLLKSARRPTLVSFARGVQCRVIVQRSLTPAAFRLRKTFGSKPNATPGRTNNCSPSHRNGVRFQAGMMYGFTPCSPIVQAATIGAQTIRLGA
jgi:hypothetical protein